MTTHRPTQRRGYTLVETVVALGVTGVLLTGIGSSLVLVSRALPDAESPLRASLDAADVIHDISSELLTAVAVTSRTATSLTFKVPDRTSDSVDDTIRYGWSGTAGGPLTRRFNSGTVVSILADVTEFSLDYELDSVTTEITPGEETATPSTIIANVPYATGLPELSDVITNGNWCGECFAPDPSLLPADTLRWSLEGVYLQLKRSGAATGITAVELRTAAAGDVPSTTIIDSQPIVELGLSDSWQAKYVSFSGAPELQPTKRICVVLKPTMGDQTSALLHQATSAAQAYASYVRSTNQGGSFTVIAGETMTLFSAYATVVTGTAALSTTTHRLQRVRILLNASNDPTARTETSARLLNEPEVTAP